MRRQTFTACVFAATFSLTSPAAFAAPTSDQCIDANAKAQSLRRDGKLAAARGQLQICVDPHCPGIVRDDCARRMDELDRLQPTIVFDGKDPTGGDISAVTVTVDGRPLASRLDGSPLSIDPGAHTFTFQTAGQPLVTRPFVVKEGEKGRIERIVFGNGAPRALVGAGASAALFGPGSSPAESAPHGMGTRKAVGLVLGGVGIAGVAVGSVFGLLASTAWNRAKSECPSSTNCTQRAQATTDRNTTETDGTIANIGFIAGGVLLATGAVVFFTAPSADAGRDHALRWRVAPSLGIGSAGIDMRGQF